MAAIATKRASISVIVLTALALVVWVGAGLGAAPKPGGKYAGKLGNGATSIEKRVAMTVSKDGKQGRVLWYCGSGRAPSSLRFPIANGRFKAVWKTGSLVVWTFTGRFISAAEARAVLDPKATCDGKGGLVVLNIVRTVADQLADAKAATAKYASVAKAEAAGYRAVAGADGKAVCAASADGGLGIRYENQSLMQDGRLDLRRPEILVYAPGAGGKLTLAALEYYAPDGDGNPTTTNDRPSLFGKPFDGPAAGCCAGLPAYYDLRVWVFQRNARGNFFPWNPAVKCAA